MDESRLVAKRFRIGDPEKDLLGRGGMGDVYRAMDTRTGQLVAIKALDASVVTRYPEALERFAREGEALRQLDHPNIVRMVAAVEEEEAITGVVAHYLVMEYVGGGSLADLLAAEGRLAPMRVVAIGLDLADALTRAHRLGILHRDLKPANVLLTETGIPRLTDFGIAHLPNSPRLTETGLLMGTVEYLSPEACEGKAIDKRGDIWSFGVLLYEMLCGQPPFEGDSLSAKLAAILTQPLPDLAQLVPGIPDALADLVYRMLERDHQQRIPSVRLVGAELEAIQFGGSLVTLAPSATAAGTQARSRFATPTPASDGPRHNLPAQATPFVGREAELAELACLLAEPQARLITILGAGGMGKTRLALEAGAGALDGFEDGVYLVPLAPLQSAQAIVPAVARAVGLSFSDDGEPRDQLLDHLNPRTMLLLLDNFEHLLAHPTVPATHGHGKLGDGDGAGLVDDLLSAAPGVKVLATSRLRLNVQGEQLFHLLGMEVPHGEATADAGAYSAVKLFVQGARRVRPGFELAGRDQQYVARICRLVAGMPLAILLAAAWVELLSPEEIEGEIAASLDFLETDLRDVPERQRSIQAVFDYSWNLLGERERAVFAGLSVFRGGFLREAAQAVTGATLRELKALVDKSLLHRTPTGRYEIHELLRQYGLEKLVQRGELEALRQR
ncbi:MAG TPA: protein kinase, partial [Anaerolineae bacterium]|nr:protein kinase [Anaerolineae bacterium]